MTSTVDPTLGDVLGAFLLAAACGGVAAAVGHLLARRAFDERPAGSVSRAATLGAAVGLFYPAGWVVALGGLTRVLGGAPGVDPGRGIPGVIAAAVLGGTLLLVTRRRGAATTDDPDWRGSIALTLAFSVLLPLGFVATLPALVPVLVA